MTVPPWRVVPAEVFDEHLSRAGLTATIDDRLAALLGTDPADRRSLPGIEAAAAELRAAVETAPLAAAVAGAITAALPRLGPGPFAVRSSMVGEDSATHSFAGMLDSFLFQPDAAAVCAALVRCWGSAFTARALAYRLRGEGALSRPAMGVVIQQMIDGDGSGVMFTAHPVTGRRDHALVTACWGLGEGVVSGACDTDELTVDRDGAEVDATVADKRVQVVRGKDGAGTAEVDVPDERRRVRCLAPAEILTTVRTDPGWAPLFPGARAILVERGSTLSHSAVLARELGLPAVVGVPNLLAIVTDGERVRLDGGAGTLERLELP